MKLYLIRHTTPVDNAPTDHERALTLRGEDEARVVGVALAKLAVHPARILVSPLLRARQTGEIISRAIGFDGEVEAIDELKNGESTESLLMKLKRRAPDDEILLVGHMPSLAEHAATLVGEQSSERFPFGKGTVICIVMNELRESGGKLLSVMHQMQLRETS